MDSSLWWIFFCFFIWSFFVLSFSKGFGRSRLRRAQWIWCSSKFETGIFLLQSGHFPCSGSSIFSSVKGLDKIWDDCLMLFAMISLTVGFAWASWTCFSRRFSSLLFDEFIFFGFGSFFGWAGFFGRFGSSGAWEAILVVCECRGSLFVAEYPASSDMLSYSSQAFSRVKFIWKYEVE